MVLQPSMALTRYAEKDGTRELACRLYEYLGTPRGIAACAKYGPDYARILRWKIADGECWPCELRAACDLITLH